MDLRCDVFCGSGSKHAESDVERRITDMYVFDATRDSGGGVWEFKKKKKALCDQ